MISGYPKFFELSKALLKNGATATASSGNDAAVNVLDFNKLTRWQSVGSDDATTETLLITFPEPVDITRLLIINHNWDQYQIQAVIDTNILDNYAADITDDLGLALEDDGAGVLDFDKVVSLTSSTPGTGISEVGYSLSSSYYEFASVYAEGLLITVDKAQELHDEPNQEKYCFLVIPTTEVNTNAGTFDHPPELRELRDFQSINNRLMNGRYRPEKQLDVFTATLAITLGISQNDMSLFEFLRYSVDDFLIWPNGGKVSGYYRFETRPYRLQDIYQVQAINAGMPEYYNNIYSNPQRASMYVRESI